MARSIELHKRWSELSTNASPWPIPGRCSWPRPAGAAAGGERATPVFLGMHNGRRQVEEEQNKVQQGDLRQATGTRLVELLKVAQVEPHPLDKHQSNDDVHGRIGQCHDDLVPRLLWCPFEPGEASHRKPVDARRPLVAPSKKAATPIQAKISEKITWIRTSLHKSLATGKDYVTLHTRSLAARPL